MSRIEYKEMDVLHNLSTGVGSECDQAFQQVWNHYQPHVYRSARNFFRTVVEAEEATQDVFLAIWKSRSHLVKLHEGEFVKYLHGVQYRVMCRILVKGSHRALAQAGYVQLCAQHQNTTDFPIREQQITKAYQLAIDGFPKERRQVYDLAVDEGRSYTEIAEALDISNNTVSYHIKNSYKVLRHVLKPFVPVVFVCSTCLMG
jgi:RNA polymerase sigma-70 factor, ECF subfamily